MTEIPMELEFARQIADAYEHLYDLVYLANHPLIKALPQTPALDPAKNRKESAWKLHHLLLDALEELNPGTNAPTFSKEWRRYRLLTLRYVDGLTPEAVADQLAVSRRQYYRMHETALETLAHTFWTQYGTAVSTAPAPIINDPASRIELLRLEATQVTQSERYAQLESVIGGVRNLLAEKLREHALTVIAAPPDSSTTLPEVAVNKSLLRQMLIGVFGYLIGCATDATLHIHTQVEDATIRLTFAVDSLAESPAFSAEDTQQRLAALDEIAALSGVELTPMRRADITTAINDFELRLPTRFRNTVLAVDDNDDVLELFTRYLSVHHYHVITARTTQDALPLARRLQPFAILLDLMMPGQDGWDLLQALLNQAETQHIPILICSVLRQKELALTLGATLFLEKPITEQMLLSALDTLAQTG